MPRSCSLVRALARVVVVSIALLAPARARAEEPAGPVSLSLPEALDRAAKRAPEVVMSGHAVREARARRVGAGILLPVNPRVNADLRPPITGGKFPADAGYAANLEMMFDLGGAPSARIREAERYAQVAEADLATERLRARAAAWTAYLRVRVAERRIEETRSLITLAERILGASKTRATAGAAGDIEQSIAAGDLAQLHAQLEDATRQRESRVSELRDTLDLPATQPVALTTPLVDPPPAEEDRELVSRAVAARPELAQIRARQSFLEASYERLKRETFPRLGMYVGVDAAPVSPIFGVLGVSVELPVAQRNQGPKAIVEAAQVGENERLELQMRRIIREVTAARAAYEARRTELEIITSTAVPAAQRALELVEAGWLAGRFDVFRVATAARDVTRTRTLRLDALEAAWMERIALDRATGGGAAR